MTGLSSGFRTSEQRLMVCGCVWVGPDPARSAWHRHLRLCGWVGRLPAGPWLDEAEAPKPGWRP